MPAPQPSDIRALLEGFGLDTPKILALIGTTTLGSAVVTAINTTSVKVNDALSGTNIPTGARVQSIDILGTSGQITMSAVATGAAVAQAITDTQYPVLSDDWLIKRRDNFVIPWWEAKTRQSFNGIQTVTEYYDGTGSSILILRRRPIVSLIAISYTNVDSNLYYLTPTAMQVITDEGILKAKANFNESTYIPIFYRGTKNIRIQYSYGYSDYPQDVFDAVSMLVAEQALTFIGNRTGGGDLSTQGYSRSFGKSGKYTHMRRQLARDAYAILKKYMASGGS